MAAMYFEMGFKSGEVCYEHENEDWEDDADPPATSYNEDDITARLAGIIEDEGSEWIESRPEMPIAHTQRSRTSFSAEEVAIVTQWSNLQLDEVLALEPTTSRDGGNIMDFAEQRSSDLITERIIPWAKAWTHKTAFTLAICDRLWDAGKDGRILDKVYIEETLMDLYASAFGHFKFATFPTTPGRGGLDRRLPADVLYPHPIAGVVEAFLSYDAPGMVETLIDLVTDGVASCSQSYPFVHFHLTIPLLYRLSKMEKLQQRPPTLLQTLQKCFKRLLACCIKHYIGPSPVPPTWRFSTLPCRCTACRSLDDFLQSPTISSQDIPLSPKHRVHLRRQLKKSGIISNLHRSDFSGTLSVAKGQTPHHIAYRAWEDRANYVRSNVAGRTQPGKKPSSPDIDQDFLKRMLGDWYDDITELRIPRSTPASDSQRPMGPDAEDMARPSAGSTATSLVPRKRPFEAITIDD
ncbi:hypothetical protein BDZ85DRAFT_84858 [Elsinoe ampelina]|uniref:Uncharacterized protein n=1 Tax=Elsinoe ampelina TaxID=302913 RepID=A0A6A6GGV7_9PEZI|nr:hypothetical protein BDZ85DRAFT_84858 [Elsinoe ampelina]